MTYNLAVFRSQQRIDLNGDIQYETLTILLHYFYYVINIRDTWQTLISCFFFSFPRCSCLFFSLSFLDFLPCRFQTFVNSFCEFLSPIFRFLAIPSFVIRASSIVFHEYLIRFRVFSSVSWFSDIFQLLPPVSFSFLRSWKNIFHRVSLSNDGASPRLNVDIESSSIAHTCTNISARKINKFLIVARHSRERITRLPSTSFFLLCATLEPFDTSVFLLSPFFDHRQPGPFVFRARVSTRYAEFGNSLTIFRWFRHPNSGKGVLLLPGNF